MEWHEVQEWNLPEFLRSDAPNKDTQIARAAALLEKYFKYRDDGRPCFTGSRFDLIGTRDNSGSTNRFTGDDIMAVSMLSENVPAQAALVLVGDNNREVFEKISEKLEQLDLDLTLIDAELTATRNGVLVPGPVYRIMDDLWWLVRRSRGTTLGEMPLGIGPTRASKLLARKRPHLFPIIDSVVTKTLAPPGKKDVGMNYWVSLQHHLTINDSFLENRLIEIRDTASEIPATLSTIRVFDILVWMHGKGYTSEPEEGCAIKP